MVSSGATMPGAGARLDGHVAEGHAPFHREAADRLARVLEDVADAAGDADLADHPERDVLRRQPRRQLALEARRARSSASALQRLRREHVLDLGRADAERERAEGTVGRRVAVAADDRLPGLREPELGADDVDDPLAPAPGGVEPDSELLAVLPQRVELRAGERILDRPGQRRDVVVHRRDGQVRPPHLPPGQAQPVEGLRRRDLVHEVQIDVEEGRLTLCLADDVSLPDLLEQAPCHCPSAYRGSTWQDSRAA